MPYIWFTSELDKAHFNGVSGFVTHLPVYLGTSFVGETQFSAPLIGSGVSEFIGESQFSSLLIVTGPLSATFEGETQFRSQLLTRIPDPFELKLAVAIRP